MSDDNFISLAALLVRTDAEDAQKLLYPGTSAPSLTLFILYIRQVCLPFHAGSMSYIKTDMNTDIEMGLH